MIEVIGGNVWPTALQPNDYGDDGDGDCKISLKKCDLK